MRQSTAQDKQTSENRTQAWPETCVVVTSSLPFREAIGEEVIISFSAGALQYLGNRPKACVLRRSSFNGIPDFALGGRLADVNTRLLVPLPRISRRCLCP